MIDSKLLRSATGRGRWRVAAPLGAVALAGALLAAAPASGAVAHPAHWHGHGQPWFRSGNLVVSESRYVGTASLLTPGVTELPPGCGSTADPCTAAVADGTYPGVFNNDNADGSFGITSPIFLAQITPHGHLVNTLPVPDGTGSGDNPGVVTSFSSKSELALNLSTSGRALSFMGYYTTPNTIDGSASNTPGEVDPTNPVIENIYRVATQVNAYGKFKYTLTNSYTGDNGRAAILNDSDGNDFFYTAGNAGNGSGKVQAAGVILSTGAQFDQQSDQPETLQSPGAPTPVGSFNITQLGDASDKIGKDTNFRGETVYNNVLYYTKGSGSNGINTVYFVDTTGKACPTTGVGVPQAGATLPTSPIDVTDPSSLQTLGVQPYNMCILAGFPTNLAKGATLFPFGIWFANPDTLYVADEGDGVNTYSATTGTYTDDASQTTAGLQKWVYSNSTDSWSLAYTLTNGLNLGVPYTVKGYPTGDNAATGLPWAPATDGLRNITGHVNRNGTVTIYAITSTVSGGGDNGADPNKLVAITDQLSATSAPASEQFVTIRNARFGVVLRGVAWAPHP
jgi:hypothetical protein